MKNEEERQEAQMQMEIKNQQESKSWRKHNCNHEDCVIKIEERIKESEQMVAPF